MSKKLLDYIKESRTEAAEIEEIEFQVEESSNNTDQEIFMIKKELSQQKKAEKTAITANPFSASKLYEARTKIELLQRKLDGVNKIKEELF